MPTSTFSLNLPRHKVLLFYKAAKNRVIVTADDGRRLSIPWELLKPFISENGIEGRFVIAFDERGKCDGLQKL